MEEQDFKVFGDENLLKEMKINIVEIGDYNNPDKVNTLLFQGKYNKVEAETEVGTVYKIYISYQDSLIGILRFENIMRNASDHINHLYVYKENEKIRVIHIGMLQDIKLKIGNSVVLASKKDFYNLNNIDNPTLVEKYNNLFFKRY